MIDLKTTKKIHFIGIKGVAMAGLALICQQRGHDVAGSDVAEKFITDAALDDAGITVYQSFAAENLNWAPELVVVGASWGIENPEVAAAAKKKLPVITDSVLRGLLSREKKTIAVTGVHGKTTTTALLAHIFNQAGLRPSFLVGTGTVPNLGASAAWDTGDYFIVEGDEYSRSQTDKTPKFLDLEPTISIITSLEWEHVDIFKDVQAIEAAFNQLVGNTKELVVACGDWPSVKNIVDPRDRRVATYGKNHGNLWQLAHLRQTPTGMAFTVKKEGIDVEEFTLAIFGEHNAVNALACIIVSLHVGIELDVIRAALARFTGTQRRFEVIERNGVTFVDDYGHHPSEIKATLGAVRQRYPDKKIICAFQPHMASRTAALLEDFANSFGDVDEVLLLDIFASAREKSETITTKDLAAATQKIHPNVTYNGTIEQTVAYLQGRLGSETVLVTMGAGNVYEVRDRLISKVS